MTTPTKQDYERAEAVWKKIHTDSSSPVKDIATALAEQRERDAKIADEFALLHEARKTAEAIAAAIRRGEA